MSEGLKILLYVAAAFSAVLLVFLCVYLGKSFYAKKPAQSECATDTGLLPAPAIKLGGKVEEEKSAPEKPIEEKKETAEAKEELVIGDIEESDEEERFENIKRIPFAVKLLTLDDNIQQYFDTIYNEFISYRKINPRISQKCVSFRFGRQLIAKLAIRGKTMKFYLALNVADFNENIFFQKDSSDVKAYEEVPFTVKVKSNRGCKNALKLIGAVTEKVGSVKKRTYTPVDSIKLIKDSI